MAGDRKRTRTRIQSRRFTRSTSIAKAAVKRLSEPLRVLKVLYQYLSPIPTNLCFFFSLINSLLRRSFFIYQFFYFFIFFYILKFIDKIREQIYKFVFVYPDFSPFFFLPFFFLGENRLLEPTIGWKRKRSKRGRVGIGREREREREEHVLTCLI